MAGDPRIGAWDDRGRHFLLLTLLAIAAFGWSIRWPIADAHSFRQTWTASTARYFAREGFDLLRPRVDGLGEPGVIVQELPIFQAGVACLYRLLGEHEVLGRLLAAAFALGASFALYIALREVAPPQAALLGAAASLLAPVSVLYGRAYLPDPLGVAACVTFLWLCLRILVRGGARAREIASLTAAGAIAATVKPLQLAPFVVALGAVALVRLRRDGSIDRVWLRSVALTLAIPAIATIGAAVAWRYQADATNAPYGRELRILTMPLPSEWFLDPSDLASAATWIQLAKRVAVDLGPAGLLLALSGVLAARRRLDALHRALVLGLVAGSAFYLVAFLSRNLVHQYYHLPLAYALAPAVAAPLAWGVFARRRAGALGVLLLSAAATVAVVGVSRREIGFPYDRDQIAEGREFRTIVPEGRPPTLFIAVQRRHFGTMFHYWADTRGVYDCLPTPASLAAYRDRGFRFVVVERGPGEEGVVAQIAPWTAPVGETKHLRVFRPDGADRDAR